MQSTLKSSVIFSIVMCSRSPPGLQPCRARKLLSTSGEVAVLAEVVDLISREVDFLQPDDLHHQRLLGRSSCMVSVTIHAAKAVFSRPDAAATSIVFLLLRIHSPVQLRMRRSRSRLC